MTALCLVLLAADPEFSIHGDFETAAVSDSLREHGGNELHVGSWFLNLKGGFKWDWVKLDVDWAEPVLDYGDEDERNSHNQNWLRADGYAARPSLLPTLTFMERTTGLCFSAGAMMSGLDPLSSVLHYTMMPASLLHARHYDKGFSLAWKASWLSLEASLVDGDWAIGQPDVFRFGDSRANSTPGILGSIRFSLPGSPWYVGATGNAGEIGSYPGEKRRQDNGLVYAGIAVGDSRALSVDLRAHAMYASRNPQGDGSGDHVPGVATVGGGCELRLGHVLFGGTAHECFSVYTMRNLDAPTIDGEIWVVPGVSRLAGIIGEVSWEYEMLRAFVGCHLMLWDEPVYDEETHVIVVAGVGCKF